MHKDTLNYFYKMKLTVLGHYGMSESTSLQTTNLVSANKFGSCGCSLKGVQVEVINTDEYKELKLLPSNQLKNDIGEVSYLKSYVCAMLFFHDLIYGN